MAEEVLKIVNEVLYAEKVKDLSESYRKQADILKDLNERYKQLGMSQAQIANDPAVRATAEGMARTRRELEQTQATLQRTTGGMGQAMYMLQSTIEDAQYGLSAIQNNLPLLFAEFGKGLGLSYDTAIKLGSLAGLIAMNVQLWANNAREFRAIMKEIGIDVAGLESKVYDIGMGIKTWFAGGEAPDWIKGLEGAIPGVGPLRAAAEKIAPAGGGGTGGIPVTPETIADVERIAAEKKKEEKERQGLVESTRERLHTARTPEAQERGEEFSKAMLSLPGGQEAVTKKMVREATVGKFSEKQLSEKVMTPTGETVSRREKIEGDIFATIGKAMRGEQAAVESMITANADLKRLYEDQRLLRTSKEAYDARVQEAEEVLRKMSLTESEKVEIEQLRRQLAREEKLGNATLILAARKALQARLEAIEEEFPRRQAAEMGLEGAVRQANIRQQQQEAAEAQRRQSEMNPERSPHARAQDEQLEHALEIDPETGRSRDPLVARMNAKLKADQPQRLERQRRNDLVKAQFNYQKALAGSGAGGMFARQMLGRQQKQVEEQTKIQDLLQDTFFGDAGQQERAQMEVDKLPKAMRQQFHIAKNQMRQAQRLGQLPDRAVMQAEQELMRAQNLHENPGDAMLEAAKIIKSIPDRINLTMF